MDKWEKILWKLLFPKTIFVFLLFNISVILLIYAFAIETRPEAVAYVAYFISAYTLTVVCARMPGIFKKIKAFLYANKYSNRILTGKTLRIRISLYLGMVVNIGFAIFKVVMGAMFQSKWLFAMAGYNVILSGMRFVLVRRDINDRNEEDEQEKMLRGLHSYRVCGWLMLLLNIAISIIVLMVVFENQKIVYPGFMIYAIAAYTFYCMIMAVISITKYRRRHNPVFAAVKRLGLAKALVSVFTMQVAMLTQFGGDGGLNAGIANSVTGFVACIIINIMAILMVLGANRDFKALRVGETENVEEQAE